MKYVKQIEGQYNQSLDELKGLLLEPTKKGSKKAIALATAASNELGGLLAIAKAADRAGLSAGDIKQLAENI